ncbi:hypothetical protein ACQY0O_006230 [Thecaphora frezii]
MFCSQISLHIRQIPRINPEQRRVLKVMWGTNGGKKAKVAIDLVAHFRRELSNFFAVFETTMRQTSARAIRSGSSSVKAQPDTEVVKMEMDHDDLRRSSAVSAPSDVRERVLARFAACCAKLQWQTFRHMCKNGGTHRTGNRSINKELASELIAILETEWTSALKVHFES